MAIWLDLWALACWEEVDFPLDPRLAKLFAEVFKSGQLEWFEADQLLIWGDSVNPVSGVWSGKPKGSEPRDGRGPA